MFWAADAGWARELYLHNIKRLGSDGLAALWAENSSLAQAGDFGLEDGRPGSTNEVAYNAYKDFMSSLGFDWMSPNSTNATTPTQTSQWPQADTSIFSSWTYLSELTRNPKLNRVLLDIFEGQLITCVVIIGFILIFLIREWVVQQQPLVNLEQLNNVQQQLREAADRVQEENERFRRQQELLDHARRRLLELQRETEDAQRQSAETWDVERPEYIGWERLEEVIDAATEMLSQGDREGFETQAPIFTEQIRAAGYDPSTDLVDFTERINNKLASYPESERREWESILAIEIRRKREQASRVEEGNPSSQGETPESESTEEDVGSVARPPMPERDFSSRATQIQRLLEEADGIFGQVHADSAAREDASLPQPELPEAGPSTARSASTESWQSISQPGASSSAEKVDESTERPFEPHYDVEKEEIPITNAGPNAKINIKRSGTGKARAVPEPKTEDKNSPENKEKIKIDEEVKKLEEEIAAEDTPPNDQQPADSQNADSSAAGGEQPARPIDDSLAGRVGSAFREEFGLEEITTPDDNSHLAGSGHNVTSNQETAPSSEDEDHRQDVVPPRHGYERLADWFWGEIQAPNSQEPVPAAREERVDDQAAGGDAPLAHAHNNKGNKRKKKNRNVRITVQ
jgi:E3 ubiquitin-protein ligase MARCH6